MRCRLSEQELSRQKEIARSWEEDRKIDMEALEEAHAAQLKQKQLQLQALSDDRATLKQQVRVRASRNPSTEPKPKRKP